MVKFTAAQVEFLLTKLSMDDINEASSFVPAPKVIRDEGMCGGKTKKGADCKKGAKYDGYCNVHRQLPEESVVDSSPDAEVVVDEPVEVVDWSDVPVDEPVEVLPVEGSSSEGSSSEGSSSEGSSSEGSSSGTGEVEKKPKRVYKKRPKL